MKKVISFMLALALVCTIAVPALAGDLKAAPATDETIKETVEVLTNAVQRLDTVFDEKQSNGIIEVFSEFVGAFRSVTSYTSAINGGVTFLKLIGVVKDGNAEALKTIMAQMAVISEQLIDMDKKLDRLTEKMNEMKASAEFNARTQKAILFEDNWKDFEYRYMEDGLDNLITQYNGKMLTGLQAWCRNEGNARTENGIDNTSLMLCYEKTDDGFKLIYNTQNGRPDTAKDDARVLVLGSDILPQSLSWNVNTYRETIKKEILNNLKSKGDLSSLNAENFPQEELDDELLEQIAEDAVNLLVYRITAGELNADPEFSLQVLRQFTNYCSHLLSLNDGIDAISKVMFLTHAFEYQIRDDYSDFMDQMAVKSGVYGSFVLDVIGMSDFITDEEKAFALDTYCSTILSIEAKKKEGLTGNDNFCYVTNKNLCFGSISFTDSAEIKTKHRGTVSGYVDSRTKDTEIAISCGAAKKAGEAARLIGDTDAILLGYYLDGGQIKFEFDFFNEKLGQGAAKDYGSTVVGLVGPQSLPANSSTTLAVTNVIGSYFSGKSTTRLSALPSGADSDGLVSRKMMNGSLMDTATGSVTANNTLSALAVYGESHWYWETDEAAFLGGPADIGLMTSSCTRQQTDVEFPSTEIFTSYYTQTVTYNCLVNEEPPHPFGASQSETLLAFAALCSDIRDSSKTVSAKQSEKNPIGPVLPFDDVTASAWSRGDISYVWEKGLMNGVSEKRFAPELTASRAMIVTVLWRLAGEPVVNYAMSFTDVAPDQWYTEAIRWAQAGGIVNGYSAEQFGPGDPVTREQMAAILYRCSGGSAPDTALSGFRDADTVSAYALDAMCWAVDNGIITGSGNCLNPTDTATRAEAAAMLHRFVTK